MLRVLVDGGDELARGGLPVAVQPDQSHTIDQALNFATTAMQLELQRPSTCKWSADHQAMELYFEARAKIQAREQDNIEAGIDLLKQALDRDPGFGQARATLASAYDMLPAWTESPAQSRAVYGPLAIATAREALAHCASLGEAWMVVRETGDYDGANQWIRRGYALRKAVALEPGNDDILQHHADILERAGYIEESLRYYRHGYELNPNNARLAGRFAAALASHTTDQQDIALAVDRANRTSHNLKTIRVRLHVALVNSHWDEARNVVNGPDNLMPELQQTALMHVIDAFEQPSSAAAAEKALRDVAASRVLGSANFVLLYGSWLGMVDLVYHTIINRPAGEDIWPSLFWLPQLRAFRDDPRFAELVGIMGLIEYWGVFGPPDGCSLEPEFRCDATPRMKPSAAESVRYGG
jgi:tetratricopeptide (TPR) repeat protein